MTGNKRNPSAEGEYIPASVRKNRPMTTKHITIEGVMHDADIDRAGDAEVIGASIREDGSLVVSIRDLSSK